MTARRSNSVWLTLGVVSLGAMCTGITAYSFWRVGETRARYRFDQAAERATDQIGDHLRTYIAMLNGGAGLFSGSEDVTPEEFARFASRLRLTEEYPGAQGIGFLNVARTPAEADAILRRLRARYGEKFEITPDPSDPNVRAVIEYIEPLDARNRAAVGRDLWAEPRRREAIERARDTGFAACTATVTLAQEIDSEKQPGFLIFVPVYSGGETPTAVEERRARITGYIFSPFRAHDLMSQIIRRGDDLGLTLSVYNGPAEADSLLYEFKGQNGVHSSLNRTMTLEIGGQTWTIRAHAARSFSDGSTTLVLAVTCGLGLLLTASLAFTTLVQARTRLREALSADRLAQSEERYRSLVAATASIVWTTNPDGEFIEPQTSWEAFTGQPWDAHRGRGWLDAVHQADRERLSNAWRVAQTSRTTFEEEGRLWNQSTRTHRWFVMRGVPMLGPDGEITEWVGLVRDIQERRHLEENLLQSRKLESLGRLAGGIAHDFNNLLTAIIGSADLASLEPTQTQVMREYMKTIREAAERSAVLTRHLLSFARKQVIEPRNVAINDLVKNLVPILERVLGENVRLVTSLPPDTGLTRIDPGQFEQVLVNLATNARDAMPGGGILTVQTANAELTPEYARTHDGVTPGSYIMLLVSDTGVGMDATVQQHIFEPFFTTKEAGKGTGLGLATCYGIVRQAGGFIWVYSEPGKGTLFRIFLPRSDGIADSTVTPPEEMPIFGTETVLVVEDEPMVRQIAAAALRGFGYSVLSATSSEEAIAIANAFAGDIHLLVTDVVLPGISGKECADRLRLVRPNIKVLFCSGYTDSVISHHGVLDQGIAFLQKPYTPRLLARKARNLLDAAVRSAK